MNEPIRMFLLFLVILFSNGIQAITGFAGTLLAMPPCIRLLDADTAKTVLNILAQVSCLAVMLTGWRHIQWRILGKMLAGMLAGMAVGVILYRILPLDFLLTVYGILILLIALQKLFFPKFLADSGRNRYWIVPLAGIIHGMFVSGGALLVVYASGVLKEKESFRSTMASVWVILGFFVTASQLQGGAFTAETARLTLLALVPMALGVWIGSLLVKRISQQAFLKLTYILLALAGLLVLV